MPVSALRPCTTPGCAALVRRGKCEACAKREQRQQDERRGSAASRGYDATWRRLRAQFLRRHPFCECDDCKASKTPDIAEVVDHIKPIEERPDLRLVESNLRAMSKRHHDAHTARTKGFGRTEPAKPKPRIGLDGWPVK